MAVQNAPPPKTDLRLSPKDKGLIRSMRERIVVNESQLKEEILKSSEDVARRVLSLHRKSITPLHRPQRTPGTGRYRTRSASRRNGDTPPTSPPPMSLASPNDVPPLAVSATANGRKLGNELSSSSSFSLNDLTHSNRYKGNRRTPRNRKHPRDPTDHRRGFDFATNAVARFVEEEIGSHRPPAVKKQRFLGRVSSQNRMPNSQGHHPPPPPPPNPPAFKHKGRRSRTQVTLTQPNGITRVVSQLAAAEAAAAAANANLSDTGSSTSSMSPSQTPTLAAVAAAVGGGAPPPPPMTQADWYKSSGRFFGQQQQHRTANSASQSPASGPMPLRRSARHSPNQRPLTSATNANTATTRRITRRLTDHRSPHYDPSVTLLPGNPPELNLNGTKSPSGREDRLNRKRPLPSSSGPSGNTRSTRARTGPSRGPSASPFPAQISGYGLRHKPHRQNRNVAQEFHTLSSSPQPMPAQGTPATSEVMRADAQADLREIMLRRQRLRDFVRAAPKTRFSELTLGKNDYSELLMPSARVISPPNSRTRILCIRKHPRDKFGTHEQVHVTDVVDQRSWVALIVGMNQTQVELLDENNKRCKIQVKDIERDRFVVTRPPPQHARAPGHHTHHPSASARQRAFR